VLRELARRQARPAGDAAVTRPAAERWPPRGICFVPRLGEYLARFEQEPLASLFGRPAALARALRRASTLLALEVECLDVPAAWILHSAGWPATVGDASIVLAGAPTEIRTPVESLTQGPLLAAIASLRTLRSPTTASAPATLVALPSPATLAKSAGAGQAEWSRAVLQALVRALGDLDFLAGIMLDGDDGVATLGRLLDHYQMTAVCMRPPGDTRSVPPGALAARALPITSLAGAAKVDTGGALLVTCDGPVSSSVAPDDLMRASRAIR
jgi:hypothetical protein